MHLVFVYGTLKKGFGNHRCFEEFGLKAVFKGRCQTREQYPLVVNGLPYLLDMPTVGKHVLGELYEVNGPCRDQLDQLESHPKFYKRRLTDVVMLNKSQKPTSEVVNAWIYFNQTEVYSREQAGILAISNYIYRTVD